MLGKLRSCSYPSCLLKGLVVVLVLLHVSLVNAEPVVSISKNSLTFQVNEHMMKLPYYRNCAIKDLHNKTFKKAVIVIHGLNRTADKYYKSMLIAAENAKAANTLILAPQFLNLEDLQKHNCENQKYLWWNGSSWNIGHNSKNENHRYSSFQIMDDLVKRIINQAPELEEIVIVGHSAGGQFVNRYAAGNLIDEDIESSYGVSLKYVVINPSSYLYFDKSRPKEGFENQFETPENPECKNYNHYKYGLENLNTYMKQLGADSIRNNYLNREVIYMIGLNDNDPDSKYLARKCSSNLQGKDRLDRCRKYFNYLLYYFGEEILIHQQKFEIPGIGHNSKEMFTSDIGLKVIFGQN